MPPERPSRARPGGSLREFLRRLSQFPPSFPAEPRRGSPLLRQRPLAATGHPLWLALARLFYLFPSIVSIQMARTHLRHIILSKWFPADDPIGILVARLSILREDYRLELEGLIKKDFNPFDHTSSASAPDSLDGNSPSWRRIYFFRSSLRTLNEIRNAVDRLFVDGAHKAALAQETLELRQAFEVLRDEIKGQSEVIKDLRDRIGGHVLHEGVGNALRGMDYGRNALIEMGETVAETHYRFAGDIALAIMFPEKSEETLLVEVQELFDKTAKLVFIVGSIDRIFDAYVRGRELLKST